jgi:hypothetical protein
MAEGVEITRELNRNFILAVGFQLLVRRGNSIPPMLRYQAQAERLLPPRSGGIRARQECGRYQTNPFPRTTNRPNRKKTRLILSPRSLRQTNPFLPRIFAPVAPANLSPVP